MEEYKRLAKEKHTTYLQKQLPAETKETETTKKTAVSAVYTPEVSEALISLGISASEPDLIILKDSSGNHVEASLRQLMHEYLLTGKNPTLPHGDQCTDEQTKSLQIRWDMIGPYHGLKPVSDWHNLYVEETFAPVNPTAATLLKIFDSSEESKRQAEGSYPVAIPFRMWEQYQYGQEELPTQPYSVVEIRSNNTQNPLVAFAPLMNPDVSAYAARLMTSYAFSHLFGFRDGDEIRCRLVQLPLGRYSTDSQKPTVQLERQTATDFTLPQLEESLHTTLSRQRMLQKRQYVTIFPGTPVNINHAVVFKVIQLWNETDMPCDVLNIYDVTIAVDLSVAATLFPTATDCFSAQSIAVFKSSSAPYMDS